MSDDLILLDEFDINDNENIRCTKCLLILDGDEEHCCRCGYKWSDGSVLYCDKCYKNDKVYYNKKNIDITHIITLFNGFSNIFNKRGLKIYSGNLRNGKYDGNGVLFDVDKNKVRYIGDFKDGEYYGMGTIFDTEMITAGYFEKSEIKEKYKTFKYHRNNKTIGENCALCCEDYDEFVLFPICGLNKCSYCCIKCIKSYFENINCSRGARLNKNMLLCPFCKNNISKNIINRYHPTLSEYIEDIEKMKDAKEILSLCWNCDNNLVIKLNDECIEHENREKFICVDCMECLSFENVKKCPNCKIKVYKIDGCHWMLCKCKKAWCWHCLKIMDPHESHSFNCKYCGKGY